MIDLLDENLIKVNFEAGDKWSAIVELIDLLIRTGKVKAKDRKKIIDVIFERESSMSTGMERGVAIPHGTTDLIKEMIASFGISKRGIPFDALDRHLSYLIILLIIPRDSFQKHIRTLAGIARLLNNEDLIKRLKASKTPSEVIETIRAEETKEPL